MAGLEYINSIKSYLKQQFSLGEEQVTIMLPDFITTLEEHMENLEEHLRKNDLDALGKSGHTLKGALINLGFHDLAELAQQIEEGGKNEDTSVDYMAISITLRTAVDQISQAGRDENLISANHS